MHAGKTRVWNRASMCLPELRSGILRHQNSWYSSGVQAIRARDGHGESGRGTQTLGSHSTRSGPAMCVADSASMRGTALPPHVAHVEEYAQEHDAGRHATDYGGSAGRTPWRRSSQRSRTPIGDTPLRLGGLGLRSAQRVAPGAFWASWADALHMIHERLPAVARTITKKLLDDAEHDGCLGVVLGTKKTPRDKKKRKRDKISNRLSGQNKKLHPGQKNTNGTKKHERKITNGTKKTWSEWTIMSKMRERGREGRGKGWGPNLTWGPVWGRRGGARRAVRRRGGPAEGRSGGGVRRRAVRGRGSGGAHKSWTARRRHTQGGPAEAGPVEGCPAEGGSRGKWGERAKHNTQHTQTTQRPAT